MLTSHASATRVPRKGLEQTRGDDARSESRGPIHTSPAFDDYDTSGQDNHGSHHGADGGDTEHSGLRDVIGTADSSEHLMFGGQESQDDSDGPQMREWKVAVTECQRCHSTDPNASNPERGLV
jgi:hypothetical protein